MLIKRITIRIKAMAAAKWRLFAVYWPSIASPIRKNLPLPSFWDQYHRDTGDNARETERKDHTAQYTDGITAKIAGGFEQLNVHLCHNGIDRQDHIREKVVNHTDHNGGFGTDDMDGTGSERFQEGVKNTGILQDRHPGICADQKVHPHRDHDQSDQDALRALGSP